MRQANVSDDALQDTLARLSRAIEEIQHKNASKLSFEEQSVANAEYMASQRSIQEDGLTRNAFRCSSQLSLFVQCTFK